MPTGQGRRTALLASLLATAVLASAGVASRRWVLERWHAWRFDHGTGEEKLAAAERLAELGSDRAVGWLHEELIKSYDAGVDRVAVRSGGILSGSPEQFLDARGRRLRTALARAGHLALRQLFQGLSSNDIGGRYLCQSTLDEVSPELWARPETTRTLERLAGDTAQPSAVAEMAREVLAWRARPEAAHAR